MSQAFSLACAQGLRTQVEETCSGKVGALSDYFPHREEARTNLDLILGAAAAAGQRKIKGQGSKNASEMVNKP
jgi:hypothetical protein